MLTFSFNAKSYNLRKKTGAVEILRGHTKMSLTEKRFKS
jgi:hypothetical protein